MGPGAVLVCEIGGPQDKVEGETDWGRVWEEASGKRLDAGLRRTASVPLSRVAHGEERSVFHPDSLLSLFPLALGT